MQQSNSGVEFNKNTGLAYHILEIRELEKVWEPQDIAKRVWTFSKKLQLADLTLFW